MRAIRTLLITAFLCLFLPIHSQAQWKECPGLYGGTVSALCSSGSYLYAGTTRGIYLSTDGGLNWIHSVNGLSKLAVNSVAADANSIVAGTSSGGVFRLVNNGTNWNDISIAATSSNIAAVAVSDSFIIAGTTSDGVYYSSDNGSTWTESITVIFPVTLIYTDYGLFAGTNAGVYRSTDDGQDWALSGTGLTDPNITAITAVDSLLYAGTSSGNVFVSTDRGGTWNAWAPTPPGSAISGLRVTGSGLIASTLYNGIYTTTDHGVTWTPSSTGLFNTYVLSLGSNGAAILAGTQGGGTYRSTDGGLTWHASSNGMTNAEVRTVIASGSVLYAGTVGAGVFSSTDHGSTWTSINNGIASPIVLSLAACGGSLFAGTVSRVYRSTDGGIHWLEADSGMTYRSALSLATSDSVILAITLGYEYYRTTNKGIYWEKVDPRVPGWPVYTMAASGRFVYAFTGTSFGGMDYLCVSRDQGKTWNGTYTPMLVTSVSCSGGSAILGLYDGELIVTDTTFSLVEALYSISGFPIRALSYHETNLVAASEGTGCTLGTAFADFSRITPGAITWSSYNAGLPPGTNVESIILDNDLLYGGTTTSGLWKRTDAGFTAITTHHYDAKWNMVSVPLNVYDPTKSVLFPHAISSAFGYETGYIAKTTLSQGVGYWIKFNDTVSEQMEGTLLTEDTVNVQMGWNMIGSLSSAIPVENITSLTPGMVTSKYFGYTGKYEMSPVIEPGKGYWVKTNEAGVLVLSTIPPSGQSLKIRFADNGETPPSPPAETPAGTGTGIPRNFSLDQNYPNPFNPSTSIQFELPFATHVTLQVYSVLGEKVRTLVDEYRPAGSYAVTMDCMGLASGVYYYRITAGNFTQTRKMTLVR
jgi:hypothetical protein